MERHSPAVGVVCFIVFDLLLTGVFGMQAVVFMSSWQGVAMKRGFVLAV